ncbi:MAG: sodium:proton antiporter [Verrucomicrobiota bacterium]
MSDSILVQITLILFLGIGSQWLASRLRLPAILLLLVVGFVVGPLMNHRWVNPDALMGDLLMPLVSLSVGLIMFEGGLTLKFRELDAIGSVVMRLISIGALITWGLSLLLARLALGWDWPLCALVGAILVVTGPTVILPLLRFLQPSRQVASALKWEGIMIDPVGALLALLVFETIHHGLGEHGAQWTQFPNHALMGFFWTLLIGGVVGSVGAGLVYFFFKHHWVHEHQQTPFALMVAVSAFTLSNHFQHESGLLATTLMGVILANQSQVDVRHVLAFKENLVVLMISTLFIVLSARLELATFSALPVFGSFCFLLGLLLVVRPLTVWVSCLGSSLNRSERLFLSWMAPRGIVAAAVASVFSMRLVDAGMAEAAQLTPVVFMVIVGTGLVYGLTAGPVARWLGVSNPDPQGVLIAGAHTLGRSLGKVLKESGFRVLMVDNNPQNIHQARMDGLPVHFGSILGDHLEDDLDLAGIGRLIALTPNHRVNSLAALHFSELFGEREVYQLADIASNHSKRDAFSAGLQGKTLFHESASYAQLQERLQQDQRIKCTSLTESYTFEDAKRSMGETLLPLFIIHSKGALQIIQAGQSVQPTPGQTLISLSAS